MIESNRAHYVRAVNAIDEFTENRGSVKDIQTNLETCRLMLEGGESAIAVELFNAVEGLEYILFARLESEQFSEAVILLGSIRERLERELSSEC